MRKLSIIFCAYRSVTRITRIKQYCDIKPNNQKQTHTDTLFNFNMEVLSCQSKDGDITIQSRPPCKDDWVREGEWIKIFDLQAIQWKSWRCN